MDDLSLYQVIKDKIIDYVEIVVLFTEHCNLKCVFCPQDHDDITGANYNSIMSKAPKVVEFINNNPKTNFVLHLMGGELFQDLFLEQNLTIAYGDFIEYVRKHTDAGKTVDFLFVTNLVYEGIEQVKGFCRKYNLQMNVSYDPSGRFNERDFELFKRNVELFKPYIHLISLVITKPSIDKMLAGDEYFDYLYNNFACDWDQLLPGKNFNPALMPSESELFTFYKLLVDRYPKCNNIKYFTEKRQQAKMSCTRGSSHTILTDGSSPQGCSGSVLLKGNTTENLGSTKIIEIFLEQNECLTCEYFSRCSFTCFIKNDYKHINRDMGKCVFKEVYKYVESK
jgi:hypothetical protein